MQRKRTAIIVTLMLAVMGVVAFFLLRRPFPPDTTPDGAYMRIAQNVAADDPKGVFAYTEQDAQWACFTIHDARAKARARIEASYPEPERTRLLAEYASLAKAPDGSDVFALLYVERGWARRLKKDLSGVVSVEVAGDRASVITAHGTRWPFRRRPNGIWGITIFTAELLADAQKAARDLDVVNAAADVYDRAK
jgi:hypothetical protein